MQALNKTYSLLLLLLFVSSSICYAQPEVYRYKRKLEGASQGWHSIPLPNELYGKLSAADLADIRIWGLTAGGDTLEMPYLLQDGAPKISQQQIPFNLINQSKNKQGYFYTLEVPGKALLNEIQLPFGDRNFDWRVVLEGAHKQGEWFTILENYRILSVQNEYTDYSFTTLRFPAISYKYLRLLIKSDEEPALMPVTLLKKEQTEGALQQYPLIGFLRQENKKEKQTQVDISLQQAVPVSSLVLRLSDTVDYYRPIRISYLADSSKSKSGWHHHYRTLYTGTLSSMESAHFTFPATITARLRLQIDNGRNRPLALEGAEVRGYRHALTTRLDDAQDYYLVYGNPLAAAPAYDIALFTDKIPAAPEILQPGPEELLNTQNLAAVHPLFSNKLWLWGIMFVLIGIMGWFTLKMLRTAQQNPENY